MQRGAPPSQEPASARLRGVGNAGWNQWKPAGWDRRSCVIRTFPPGSTPGSGQWRKKHGRRRVAGNGAVLFKAVPAVPETGAIGHGWCRPNLSRLRRVPTAKLRGPGRSPWGAIRVPGQCGRMPRPPAAQTCPAPAGICLEVPGAAPRRSPPRERRLPVPDPARPVRGEPRRLDCGSPHSTAGWNGVRIRPFPDGSEWRPCAQAYRNRIPRVCAGMPRAHLERRARRRGMPAGRDGAARFPDVAECLRFAVSPHRRPVRPCRCPLRLGPFRFGTAPHGFPQVLNPMRVPKNRPVGKSMAGRSAGREQGSAPRGGWGMRGADERAGNTGGLPLSGKTGAKDGTPSGTRQTACKKGGGDAAAPPPGKPRGWRPTRSNAPFPRRWSVPGVRGLPTPLLGEERKVGGVDDPVPVEVAPGVPVAVPPRDIQAPEKIA